ncbi:MAG TPA: SDR family oxidoreductase [Nitrososphaeraceae archaeon]|jgi:NAD(P)-dependent dehydrogenase (short-subunit alcohol dehydrogenase family)|nr:SDR family oxidoreductase [Nitrososphaeraceae archaeon]
MESSTSQKVAIVTGSSTGIGYETSLALARNGFLTYATMRNLNKAENIKSVATKESLTLYVKQLDVTDDASVKNAVEAISSETRGRIDVLVNNAGYGLNGAFEDLAMDEIKAQYETNVFGLIRVTQAVLPTMRRQKSGTIVNISSGAGRFGFPSGSAYVSTKFAVEGLSESISYELEPFGIKVVIVEPGVIRTNFGNGLVVAKKSQHPNSPYSQMMKKIANSFEELMKNSSSPSLVANVVLKAVKDENPSLRYLAGNDVEQWLGAKRTMSDEEFYKMMSQNFT